MTSIDLAATPPLRDGLTRRVTVTPSMCGSSSLIFAQLGDWTWEAVSAACRTNVYAAQTVKGQPAYLSFYYIRVRGSETFHPYSLTFGDELKVDSRVFDLGSQSVLTLHRLSRAHDDAQAHQLDPIEFYEQPRDCLYVESFNRWISRSRPDSNESLASAAPEGFQHDHLPRLPGAHSLRATCFRARQDATFYPSALPGYVRAAPDFTTAYTLDAVRDINGVGLVYFASYFSIVDTALLRLWRQLGRTNAQFLRRHVTDYRLGFFGNADVDSTFTIDVRLWRNSLDAGDEIADVTIRDRDAGRLLAVAGMHLLTEKSRN
jgi:probable biosynthetic protein (TIGR04098 family)